MQPLTTYYISQGDGRTLGPYRKDTLIANGLTPNTLVWRQGMSAWATANVIPELNDLLVETPPPLPVAAPEAVTLQAVQTEIINEQTVQTEVVNEQLADPLKSITKYQFPAPTWRGEAVVVLICVVFHFFFGLANKSPYYYLLLDLIGFIMCVVALVIGTNISSLNRVSYVKDTPTRIKADKLADSNGKLVCITSAIGFIIILVQTAYKGFFA